MPHTTWKHLMTTGSFRRALLAAVSVAALGCSTDSILQVDRPDIIDPSNLEGALGATARYNGAFGDVSYALNNPGGSSLMLASGLFSDEFRFGGTPPEVRQFDLDGVLIENSFAQSIWLNLHRGRVAAEKAAEALATVDATDKRIAEMKALASLVTIWLGETYCSGLTISDYGPPPVYGSPMATSAVFDRAVSLLDEAAPLAASDASISNLVAVLKGRALLNNAKYAEAAAAVASVPTNYLYQTPFSSSDTRTQNGMKVLIYDFQYMSVSDHEGGNGLNFATAGDPRVPVDFDPDHPVSQFDNVTPMYYFTKYSSLDSPVTNASGIEARLIEAEAALQAGDPTTWLNKLNEARATLAGLAPLTDPGTADGRVDLMFRERAFWMFGTAHRLGDMRRLVRQYGRAGTTVFPTGPYHKDNLTRQNQQNILVPQTEQNNPNYDPSACDNTKA